MNRRKFVRLISQSLVATALWPKPSHAAEPKDKRPIQCVFAQIKYRGGDWNPQPLAVTPLMEELMLRTSVEAATVRREMSLTDRDLFSYPFLYITGKYEFEPFSQDEIDILRRFVSYGGFLLIDDAPPGRLRLRQGDAAGDAKNPAGKRVQTASLRPCGAAQLLSHAAHRRREN